MNALIINISMYFEACPGSGRAACPGSGGAACLESGGAACPGSGRASSYGWNSQASSCGCGRRSGAAAVH
jgi:hypothetical protein